MFMDSWKNQILSIPLSSIHSLYLSIVVATEMQAYKVAWRSHISSRECALCHLIMCFMSEKHIMRWHKAHSLDDICDRLHATLYACISIATMMERYREWMEERGMGRI